MQPVRTELDTVHNERGGGNRTMAMRQEMRRYVCGQCHVEYYFQGAEKRTAVRRVRGPCNSLLTAAAS
jgi:formate-dependent nitrite reductase cytochrome c552 subunit